MSDNLRILQKGDVTPALMELCRESRHSCAGTFHKIYEGDFERELPCIGGGLLISEFTQSYIDAANGFDMAELAEHMGLERTPPQSKGDGQVTIAHIRTTVPCPCQKEQASAVEHDWLKRELSVEATPTPSQKQADAFRKFNDEHRSLYIYGPPDQGKTYLAYICAKAYRGKRTIFLNTKLSEFFRKNSHELSPADFKGLVVVDDIQENIPSPFFQSALFEALDLVKRKKLRMIICANLTPLEFVERYAVDELRKPQFENRLFKMEIIELP